MESIDRVLVRIKVLGKLVRPVVARHVVKIVRLGGIERGMKRADSRIAYGAGREIKMDIGVIGRLHFQIRLA